LMRSRTELIFQVVTLICMRGVMGGRPARHKSRWRAL
jgi:hypothetical protein